MSSEPPRMDIIASGDHRQREGERGKRWSVLSICFTAHRSRWQSLLNPLLSIFRLSGVFIYVQVTII